jgi:hypothetical protein
MQATIKTYGGPSFATKREVLTIPITLAERVVKVLDCRAGCYWDFVPKSVRRAKRAKCEAVAVDTAGFGTDELREAIRQVGGSVVIA